MIFGASVAASVPLAGSKAIPVPPPSLTVRPPPERTFRVPRPIIEGKK